MDNKMKESKLFDKYYEIRKQIEEELDIPQWMGLSYSDGKFIYDGSLHFDDEEDNGKQLIEHYKEYGYGYYAEESATITKRTDEYIVFRIQSFNDYRIYLTENEIKI